MCPCMFECMHACCSVNMCMCTCMGKGLCACAYGCTYASASALASGDQDRIQPRRFENKGITRAERNMSLSGPPLRGNRAKTKEGNQEQSLSSARPGAASESFALPARARHNGTDTSPRKRRNIPNCQGPRAAPVTGVHEVDDVIPHTDAENLLKRPGNPRRTTPGARTSAWSLAKRLEHSAWKARQSAEEP